MSKQNMEKILNKIKEYDRIFLFRHKRIDGDCTGATKGFKEILKLTYPEKEIYIIDNEKSDFLAFLGEDDAPVADELYADALGIVLDTATTDRIASDKYALCRELVKIDHHIEVNPYGVCSWVEEESSSCCEMIVKFYDTFRDELKINREAATYLYTGMVTDSGRFRYDSTTSQTFRLASRLLEEKFDTGEVYAGLYADDFEHVKLRAQFILKIHITDLKVAYIYTEKEELKSYNASIFSISRGMVGTMGDLRGVDIWVNFTETEDGVLTEIRSSKYNINPIAVKYGGGGHQKASGATLKNREEAMAMLEDLNEIIRSNAK